MVLMEPKVHWEAIYKQRGPGKVSWFKSHLEISLKLLAPAGFFHLACAILTLRVVLK